MTNCDSYRVQHWAERAGQPLCADPLGDLLQAHRAGDNAAAERLAADLSGRYGPFAVEFVGEHTGAVKLDGTVYYGRSTTTAIAPEHPGAPPGVAGSVKRTFCRDPETSEIVAHHDLLYLYNHARRRGFSPALWEAIEPYYRRSGVARIELRAMLDDGGLVWARAGYDWDRSGSRLEQSLAKVRSVAQEMESAATTTPSAKALLRAVIDSLNTHVDDLPSPLRLANLSTEDSPNLGRTLMRRAEWYAVLYL